MAMVKISDSGGASPPLGEANKSTVTRSMRSNKLTSGIEIVFQQPVRLRRFATAASTVICLTNWVPDEAFSLNKS